jgi:hypothetical protein
LKVRFVKAYFLGKGLDSSSHLSFFKMNVSASLRDDLDMKDVPASWGLFNDIRWVGLLLVLGLLLPALATPAGAQISQDRNGQQRGNSSAQGTLPGQQQSSPVGNLPDWAEPSQHQGKNLSSGDVDPRAPDPPGNPSRIPVDGGVALLAAAGAGYAVRKLNEEDEDDPPA